MSHSRRAFTPTSPAKNMRSEEHTSELQSHLNLVCRLLLEKKKKIERFSSTGIVTAQLAYFRRAHNDSLHILLVTGWIGATGKQTSTTANDEKTANHLPEHN